MGRPEKSSDELIIMRRVALLFGIFALLLVFCLAAVSFHKDLYQTRQKYLDLEKGYIAEYSYLLADSENAEELLERLKTGRQYERVMRVESGNTYVYDITADDLQGTGDLDRVRALVDRPAGQSVSQPGYQYSVLNIEDHFLVLFEASTEPIRSIFRQEFTFLLCMLAAGVGLLALLLYVVLPRLPDESLRRRVMVGGVFALVLVTSLVTCSDAQYYDASQYRKVESAIYYDLDQDIHYINSLSDEQRAQLADIIRSSSDETNTENVSDSLLILRKWAEQYSSLCPNITFNRGNEFDETIPIRDRVTLHVSRVALFNFTFSYFLESMMISLSALVIFLGTEYYRDSFSLKLSRGSEADPFRRVADRQKLTVTVKSLADAVTVTVTVKMLKSFLQGDFGEEASSYLSAVISVGALLTIICILLLPWLLNRFGNVTRLFPVLLLACCVGNFLCFAAGNSVVMVAGYLILTPADAAFDVMYLLPHNEFTADSPATIKAWSRLSNGRNAGAALGLVLSGALIWLLPYRYLYLIAGCLLLFCLPLVLLNASETVLYPTPSGLQIHATLRNRPFLLYMLLVDAPYSLIAYYFKYVVPLAADSLGVTHTLVTFLFFFRTVCVLFFKRQEGIKRAWARLSEPVVILVSMLAIAVLLVGPSLRLNIPTLVIGTLLLALIQARANSMVLVYGVQLSGSPRYTFGYGIKDHVSKNISKTVANSLVQNLGLISLPCLVAGCGVLWFALNSAAERENRPGTPAETSTGH